MRRAHLTVGLLGVIAFLITGQVMGHHNPSVKSLMPDVRMMYVSRHIYLLGAALVNLVLGLYMQGQPAGWRGLLQKFGSLLILLSPLLVLMAFIVEPGLGMAGRGWRSLFGMVALFAGVMSHFAASLWSKAN